MKIEELYFSMEKELVDGDPDDFTYTDVIVRMDDGGTYIASFFSYHSIGYLTRKHQETGAFLSGKYFRADNILLINDCSKAQVIEVIEDLIDEGDFISTFKLLTKQ